MARLLKLKFYTQLSTKLQSLHAAFHENLSFQRNFPLFTQVPMLNTMGVSFLLLFWGGIANKTSSLAHLLKRFFTLKCQITIFRSIRSEVFFFYLLNYISLRWISKCSDRERKYKNWTWAQNVPCAWSSVWIFYFLKSKCDGKCNPTNKHIAYEIWHLNSEEKENKSPEH